jgi:hypothetical protein
VPRTPEQEAEHQVWLEAQHKMARRDEILRYIGLAVVAVIVVVVIVLNAVNGDDDEASGDTEAIKGGCFYLHYMNAQVRAGKDELILNESKSGARVGVLNLDRITPPSELTESSDPAAVAMLADIEVRRADGTVALQAIVEPEPNDRRSPDDIFAPFFDGARATWQQFNCAAVAGRGLNE